MQYMLVMLETEADFAKRQDPNAAGAYWGAWMSYAQAIHDAGIQVAGAGLQPPSTATTVRLRDGQRLVQDGPFADTKEQLAGFFIIDVPDLDTALGWAAQAPCASGPGVEVRPVLLPPSAA
ncbi:MAG: YciI family protein [Alphaproteobacteria bacterium]|nr:YciI family protein [Alphaproteobacteria bacterium]